MAKGIRLGFEKKVSNLKEKLERQEKQLKKIQENIKSIKAEINSHVSKEILSTAQNSSLNDEEKLEKLKSLNSLI
jgi:Skp family chaperone for outer membrane proteins